MIGIEVVRADPGLVKVNIKKKYQDVGKVDRILEKDEKWRKLKGEVDNLRAERNKISKEINDAKKAGKDAKALLKKAKEIPEKIADNENKAGKLRVEIDSLLSELPNIMHPSVPEGKDENDNPVVRKWGKIKKPGYELKNHAELIESWGAADFEAGRQSSGAGFNYLLGDMALLDHALQRYGVDFLLKKGFKLVVPPMMLSKESFLGAANGITDIEDVVYKIEGEDLYMIGTAEHSLISMMKGKDFLKEDLPAKICALTPCFRKEIGSRGVDTKGLFRMHQFNKVEQVVFSLPENSFKILEELQKITEEFFKSLEIPYRVIEICSGDLGNKFAKQYDIEAWFPRQEKYREVTSAGNCTDFQSRALGIRYWDKGERKQVHILNNTMVATSRAMVAILENFQQKDGSVKVPKVLQKYIGKKVIGNKK